MSEAFYADPQNRPRIWTPWGEEEPDPGSPGDPAVWHKRFQALAQAVADDRYPWLMTVLRHCNAIVMASIGNFTVLMPRDEAVEIPELSAALLMTPWADDDQPQQ